MGDWGVWVEQYSYDRWESDIARRLKSAPEKVTTKVQRRNKQSKMTWKRGDTKNSDQHRDSTSDSDSHSKEEEDSKVEHEQEDVFLYKPWLAQFGIPASASYHLGLSEKMEIAQVDITPDFVVKIVVTAAKLCSIAAACSRCGSVSKPRRRRHKSSE